MSSAQDYYPFGMQMPGRTYVADSTRGYRYGFNGMEQDDEVKGSGNSYDFGARMYDSRLGRWWSVDALAVRAPNETPYNFAANSPVYFIDPDGNFKLSYTEKQLQEAGLTKQDVVRFEAIVNNIYNLVKDNPHALNAIASTTGFSVEQIAKDFEPDQGPNVIIENTIWLAEGGVNGIKIDPSMVKALARIDGTDVEQLSSQTLGMALTLLHEYGHYGDQVNNSGSNTGQYRMQTSGNLTYQFFDAMRLGGNNSFSGEQFWKQTLTGHRGDDVTTVGFGVNVSVLPSGNTELSTGSLSPAGQTTDVQIPMRLPEEASGVNILETLKVE